MVIWASESDFWRFWDLKIHWGPALRAKFITSAEPRASVTVRFERGGELWIWLVETAEKQPEKSNILLHTGSNR